MEPFDPYAIECPSLLKLSVAQNRRMPVHEKVRRICEAFTYVRQKHREYVRRRDPNATEDDIMLEWLRLKGDLSEDFLIGLMLAYEDRFIDKPILAPVCSVDDAFIR
jgi:hypothetical protein